MSKKRDERYLDAKALAADVKRSLAHQPVSVYRTGAWERLRLWRRRNPVVASLSLFLAVSLLTGTVVSTLFGLAANRESKRANESFQKLAAAIRREDELREAVANAQNEIERLGLRLSPRQADLDRKLAELMSLENELSIARNQRLIPAPPAQPEDALLQEKSEGVQVQRRTPVITDPRKSKGKIGKIAPSG